MSHAPAAPQLIFKPWIGLQGKKGVDITAYFHIRSRCLSREGRVVLQIREREGKNRKIFPVDRRVSPLLK